MAHDEVRSITLDDVLVDTGAFRNGDRRIS
jgi:hypothetical protein